VQRVIGASVTVIENGGRAEIGRIGTGLLLLVGVAGDDTAIDAGYLADKAANLRVFEDDAGKMNRSVLEVGGSALVVSNFTLYGDCRKGRRPSFTSAGAGEQAASLYELFGARLAEAGVPVQFGKFGAQMEVALVNDGPITLLLDSRRGF
jgi:D-tyrosyl-tRNA(Tyr) deacylase